MKFVHAVLLCFLVAGIAFPLVAHAQETSLTGNAICVLTFEDANANRVRDASEVPLAGITITLKVEGVIIRSAITTDENRRYCFDGLPDGDYILTFVDAPTHSKTTGNEAALPLSDNTRKTAEFGAVKVSPFEQVANQQVTDATDTLSTANRIILGVIGAVIVLVLMMGLGLLIAGFMF